MARPPLLNIFSSCRPYFSSGWGRRQTAAAAGGAPEPGQQTLDSATSVCVYVKHKNKKQNNKRVLSGPVRFTLSYTKSLI